MDEIIGQDHLVGPTGPLRRLVQSGRLVSMILWGPAGSGKTTLARLVAADAGYHVEAVSAVASGVKEIRSA
ncbi:MAG: AAA family ATPase, partial [Acidobacteria bacterium]|nr:AAA family ATPase [Acidobacteriota bacterium]